MMYFSLIALVPLFVLIIDGYYEKNIKKGIYHVLIFLGIGIVTIFLIKMFGLDFIFITPIILLALVILKTKTK